MRDFEKMLEAAFRVIRALQCELTFGPEYDRAHDLNAAREAQVRKWAEPERLSEYLQECGYNEWHQREWAENAPR